VIPITSLCQSSVKDIATQMVKTEYEGKCKEQGYIKPDSIELMNTSYGVIMDSSISVEATFNCMTFHTCEGDLMYVIADSITRSAGVKALIEGENPSPAIVLIPKDFHIDNKLFNEMEVGKRYLVRTINQQFILNDKTMVVIACLV
jgi:DNA-directed RNA polymerase subunit E'/Rpb7